jgi:hypothetical protein
VGRLEERRPLGRPRHRGMIILKWIFKMWDGAWTGLIWLRIGTGGALLYSFNFIKLIYIFTYSSSQTRLSPPPLPLCPPSIVTFLHL